MKTLKVTPARYAVLEALTRKDIATLRKYPKILRRGQDLVHACEKVIKRLESMPPHANRRKRETAYKRMVRICQKALERVSD